MEAVAFHLCVRIALHTVGVNVHMNRIEFREQTWRVDAEVMKCGNEDKRASGLVREGGGHLPAMSKTCGEDMEARQPAWGLCGRGKESKRKR